MLVFVFKLGMGVKVFVMFRQVKPDTCRHESSSHNERERQRLAHRKCPHRTKKRSNREIRARSSTPEVTEGNHEQRKAHSVGKKAKHESTYQMG